MRYPFMIINKQHIESFMTLLQSLGYCKIPYNKNLPKYAHVVLDSLGTPGKLAFYKTIIPNNRDYMPNIYKFVRIAAIIKKTAPSINTRLYLLKL